MEIVLDYLFVNMKVLHRDISPNNILLVRGGDGAAHCLLIDYDYATTVKTTSEQQVSHGFRTVCTSIPLRNDTLASNFSGDPTIHGSGNYVEEWQDILP
jgi:serine/threonine protein kinase